jgi:hypothetical protein
MTSSARTGPGTRLARPDTRTVCMGRAAGRGRWCRGRPRNRMSPSAQLLSWKNSGVLLSPGQRTRPPHHRRLTLAPKFQVAFPRTASEPDPAGRRAAHLRSVAGRARLRRLSRRRNDIPSAEALPDATEIASDLHSWSWRGTRTPQPAVTRQRATVHGVLVRAVLAGHVWWVVQPARSCRGRVARGGMTVRMTARHPWKLGAAWVRRPGGHSSHGSPHQALACSGQGGAVR